MAETGYSPRWPVCWGPAVRRAVDAGNDPDVLLEDPRLAAHRVLDRLAALAHDIDNGIPHAQAAFADAIEGLVDAAPWLVTAAQRRTAATFEAEPGYGRRRGAAPEADDGASEPFVATMVDEDGLHDLVATALASLGWSAASLILELSATAVAAEPWFAGDDPIRDDILRLADAGADGALFGGPGWERLSARAPTAAGVVEMHRCAKLLDDFMGAEEFGRPEPTGPLTWATGIESVDVADGCSPSPTLTIHGRGFGASQPGGVAVIAPVWDPMLGVTTYREVAVSSWADRQVVVRLDANAVGGALAFANTGYLAAYQEWSRKASKRVAELMRAEQCAGFNRPLARPLWPPLTLTPPAGVTVTYQVGAPRVVAEVSGDPLGKPATRWSGAHAQVQSGSAFWIVWRSVNADGVTLRPLDAAGSQVLQASGQPAAGVDGLTGAVRLIAPPQAVVLQFAVEARSQGCGTVRTPLRIVITGAPIGPVRMTVLQALPGGDVDVVSASGVETFAPTGGRSIALVAEKRTVVRIDWWPAIPQVPEGESTFAVATLNVRNHEVWPRLSGPLLASESTADPPSATGISLPGGRPFSSLAQYDAWVEGGNDPATFNIVMPADWCMWEAILEAKVRVITPGPVWDVSTVVWVKFHRRRRVRIRYRRYTNSTSGTTATTEEAVDAIRRAASMLPIPDPEILVLGNDPAAPTTAGYIEDMIVERGGTPTPSWRDEIWLVIGPPGDGGVADVSAWPWTAAAGATGDVIAHEIGHTFSQSHIALCGAAQNPEQPATFPDMGNVVPIGWNILENAPVRQGIDVMSYCGNRWISPERWRRIFTQLGPPP